MLDRSDTILVIILFFVWAWIGYSTGKEEGYRLAQEELEQPRDDQGRFTKRS